MNFFKMLFGKPDNKDNVLQKSNLTPEQFFATDEVKELIARYKRTTTLLKPHTSKTPIGQNESKFGGIPNFSGFDEYPCCDGCKTPLNFVVQLYKKDFPGFYFSDNSTLFQLFRCPNNDCPDAYSEKYDHKMFHFYFNVTDNSRILTKPYHSLADGEDEVPDCYLNAIATDDFPNYDDFEGDDFVGLEKKFGNEFAELFMDKYAAIQSTKFGGYPSYIQSPQYPTCTCGNTKEFFFQLSSEDVEDGTELPPPADQWSSHGIMIGDVGNIYYYVCKSCGQKTIETNWDCY